MLPLKLIVSLFVFVFIIFVSSAVTGKSSRNYCKLMNSLGGSATGCPATKEVNISKSTGSQHKRLLHTIVFKKSTEITSWEKDKFHSFVNNSMSKKGYYEIIGHASKERPSSSAIVNNKISENRANHIKRILIKDYGFKKEHLFTKSFGFYKLLPGIDPGAEKQQRVEIYQSQ